MKKEKIVDNTEGNSFEEVSEELNIQEEEASSNENNDKNKQEETVDVEFLMAENQRLKEEYLRAYAEIENTKKRCAHEIEKNNKYAISSFAKGLLSVADNLHRAIYAVPEEQKKNNKEVQALLTGVELTENELMKVFNKFGVTKMNILDTVFDPHYHQVVQEVEDKTKLNGTIMAELQTGYMLNDRILREAMVVVSKGGPSAPKEENKENKK